MNYVLKEKHGQDAVGYVELFVTDDMPKGERGAAIVNYMAADFNEHPFPRIAVTLLTEKSLDDITKGTFYGYYNELLDQHVKLNAQKYFKNAIQISYLDTVTVYIDSIDGVSVY